MKNSCKEAHIFSLRLARNFSSIRHRRKFILASGTRDNMKYNNTGSSPSWAGHEINNTLGSLQAAGQRSAELCGHRIEEV